jgi:hypothetical protein
MARDGMLSNVGLALGGLVALVFLLIVVVSSFYSRRDAAMKPPSTAPGSDPGWQIRYTATRALARRGSDHVKEKMDELKEMLDEDVQRQNFRTVLKGGKDTVNEAEAAEVVTSTLKAVEELHRRRPDMDLSALKPAINRLTQSSNPALRGGAAHARTELGIE